MRSPVSCSSTVLRPAPVVVDRTARGMTLTNLASVLAGGESASNPFFYNNPANICHAFEPQRRTGRGRRIHRSPPAPGGRGMIELLFYSDDDGIPSCPTRGR